ncbi:MAG: ABC transporter substrate-binding protein [Ardenticatenaceae bacterium]
MKNMRFILASFLMLLTSGLVACGASEPQVVIQTVEVVKEVEVEKEVEVIQTVEVEVEKEVEVVQTVEVVKEVEVEVEVVKENRGTLRMSHGLAWGGTENMDPVDTGRLAQAIQMVYDQLVSNDGNGVPQPSLAVSWEANKKLDEWTFNLRDGVEFHDGTPFTAADVVFSVEWWKKEPSTVAPVVELIEEVEAVDDQTVVFKLDQPHADFPLVIMDYRARILQDGTPEEDIKEEGMGTGPYKLEKLDAEGTTILVANDDYWRGPPGAAKVEIIGIADAEASFQAIQAGQIDLFDTGLQHAEVVEGNDNFNVINFPTGAWTGLIMNTSKEPYDNVELRQAMRLVANRQEMVDLALGGAGVVACDTPVNPADAYRFDTDCSQDIERAKELLKEAGYEDGFDAVLYTSDVCTDFLPLAEVYQQQAAEAGINIEIKQAPSDGYWTDTWMVEAFTMTCWGERPADQILNEAYRSGGPWNESYWDSDDFDTLLDDARQAAEFDDRKAAYVAAQELLWEEGGSLIPYHNAQYRITAKCVFNVPAVYAFSMDYAKISKTKDCNE